MAMAMAMAMGNYCLIVVVCIAICGSGSGGWAQSLADECASKLPEVMTCVAFASGKESTPQKKCCDSVTEMKESNPACLCFLIQQIHNGTNPAFKSMNIQETRLLQLPSACKLANASITDCPKLLKLPPNSPDAAIFNNVTTTTTTTTTPTTSPTTGATASSTSTSPSHGFKYEAPLFLGSAMASLLFYVLF